MSIKEGGWTRKLVRRQSVRFGAAIAAALTVAAFTASGASAVPPPPGGVGAPCIEQTFSETSIYYLCVQDEQILLNDLWYSRVPGPNQLLQVDGYYGPHTSSDVSSFNSFWAQTTSGTTTLTTWYELCRADALHGYEGAYWHQVGCPDLV